MSNSIEEMVTERKGKPKYNPWSVAISPTDGSIWLNDTSNGRLVKY